MESSALNSFELSSNVCYVFVRFIVSKRFFPENRLLLTKITIMCPVKSNMLTTASQVKFRIISTVCHVQSSILTTVSHVKFSILTSVSHVQSGILTTVSHVQFELRVREIHIFQIATLKSETFFLKCLI